MRSAPLFSDLLINISEYACLVDCDQDFSIWKNCHAISAPIFSSQENVGRNAAMLRFVILDVEKIR